jgi:uncharacterized repeat protein (TIGR03803 family)
MEDDMGSTRFSRSMIKGLAIVGVVAILSSAAWASGGTTVVYSFAGDEDGEYPSTDLVVDRAGNLYGTSVQGGEFGGGTVFQLTPSGTHTVLYSFTGGADGGQPYGGVTLDPKGNIYGATVVGGSGGACEDGCGVAYQLSYSGGAWTQTVLHNFTGGDDGSGPGAGLTLDTKGNLFGMTPTGGAYGLGVIYQLKPERTGGWKFRVVHTFTGGDDGATGSAGRLLLDDAGNLFGVATVGGANGSGTAFKLERTQHGNFEMKTLYAFKGDPDAGFPYGALTFDQSGNLYGTTYYDGANELGTVYQLSNANGTWTEQVLYSFKGGTDGASPISSLLFDHAGNLYGTTSEGGAPGCGCGTIFKLTPGDQGNWTESVVHAFTGIPDGAFPYNGMVADRAGNFYGTTVHGGADGEGAIYQFIP